MLWTIIVILLVLWLLGLIGGIGGNLIYLLLVIAAIVLLFQLLSGRRSVGRRGAIAAPLIGRRSARSGRSRRGEPTGAAISSPPRDR